MKAWKKAWKPWFYHGFHAFTMLFLFYKSMEKAWKA